MTDPHQPHEQPYFGQPQPTFQPRPYGEPPLPPGPPAPPYSQPAYPGASQPFAVPQEPGMMPPAVKKSKLPTIIAAAVAVVALAAAGVVFAQSRGWFAAAGASSPTEAVENVFQSLADGDVLGVVDSLVPSEAAFAADMASGFVQQLSRLDVVKPSTTVDQLYAVDVTVTGLAVSKTPIVINDHVQVVEVTDGTLTFSGARVADVLTDKVRAALPDVPTSDGQTGTVDIAAQMADTGGALRIAAVSVDGRWYPSVAYTIADNAAYVSVGADYGANLAPIGARGAATPQAAMDEFVSAVASGDMLSIAASFDPGTMGALQEYASLAFSAPGTRCMWGGGMDIHAAPAAGADPCPPSEVSIVDSSWTTDAVTGGEKVSVASLTLATPAGDVVISRNPAVPSLTITSGDDEPIVVSPESVDDLLGEMSGLFGVALSDESAQVTDMIKRELEQVLNLGIVMVQGADGQWYVSPMRTYSEVAISLLRGLQPADIDYVLSLATE